MDKKLKLISVNIEGDNHLERVLEFLNKESPDVVCMQEVFVVDVQLLTEKFGMHGVFAPLATVTKDFSENRVSSRGDWGLLILSKYPLTNVAQEYYAGSPDIHPAPEFDGNPNAVNRILLSATIEKQGVSFTIATTHFTWSVGGETTDLQRDHYQKLLTFLQQKKEIILCGDFNAPRGREIFSKLAERYTDNIPQDVTTTLDQNLHKVPGLQYVVDGIFSSPEYKVEDVRVVEGVSDHKPIVGMISRV